MIPKTFKNKKIIQYLNSKHVRPIQNDLVSNCHTHQDVPNILIGSFKAAEADAEPQQSWAAPHGAGCDGGLSHCQHLAAV